MTPSNAQYVDLWGSVQYEDRPENHVTREINGEEKLIHSVVVKSSATGANVYVSFFEDSFPGFEHPGANKPIFIHGTLRQNGEYSNVTAKGYALLPGYVQAKRREAF